jgi:hypothetical protein
MLCALTVRKLKPGSYDDFRKAWQTDPWPEGWLRAYHVRRIDDENEVVSFGFFDGTIEELRATQQASDYRTLRSRTGEFEEAILVDGIYEVLEEVLPPGS